jgi:hypothetical protein
MDTAQLGILLDQLRSSSQEHFGVDLRFTPPVEVPISELFQRIPAEHRDRISKQIYDFKTGKGDVARFERVFGETLRANGDDPGQILEYARDHLDNAPAEQTYEALGSALAKLQLDRVHGWKTVRALDGGPAIDSSPYNEFVFWDSIGYADFSFEVVLTNQVIASVEYVNPAAHAAIRGGYSNGLTTYNRASRLKTTAIWSTFAFTSKDAWVVKMRGNEAYEPNEAARLAGIGATHEIGHQLFHLGHPFGRAACVMNPVPMFAFRAWADKLSPQKCPIGSAPAMRPGTVRFAHPRHDA